MRLGIELQVDSGINHGDGARVCAGRRIEGGRCDRSHTGVEGTDLSGQHALAEPAVARPQDRSAIGGELCRNTQAWRPEVPGVQRAQAADDRIGFRPLWIERAQVLTDGAAVIEPHSGINRQPVPHRDGVARESGGCDEQTALVGGSARDGLKRLSAAVDEPHTRRNDRGRVVLAPFDLSAHLPLVIGTQQPRPVVADRRLGGCAHDRQRAELWRSAAGDTRLAVEPARRRPIAGARRALLGVDEPSDAHIPQGVGRQRVRQVAEGHGRHRRARARDRFKRRHERRPIGVHPELVAATRSRGRPGWFDRAGCRRYSLARSVAPTRGYLRGNHGRNCLGRLAVDPANTVASGCCSIHVPRADA